MALINNSKKRALTLLELILVVVIIVILTGIGIPNYYKAKERALSKEAIANLKLIASAERIYRMESTNQAYFSCQCLCGGTGATCCDNTTNGCNYFLKLSLTTSNWTYNVTASGAGASATFTATADRQGSGGYLNCQYTLTSAQAIAGEDPEKGAGCP